MTALGETNYNEALGLPIDERLAQIDRLLHLSNITTDSSIDKAWMEEVGRRDRQIEEGTARLIPADEVLARIEKRLAQ